MKIAVLITSHCWHSKRRAGFHWIAEGLWRKGWEVYFVTCLSWVDKVKRDYRFKYIPSEGVNKVIPENARFNSYFWFNPWRPADLRNRFLNKITYPWFSRYGKLPLGRFAPVIRSADLIVHESMVDIMFLNQFKQLNPQARFVYRVSDDLNLMNIHPVVLDTEEEIASRFDLVSVPALSIYQKFAHLPNVRLHKHGVPVHLYDLEYENPFNAKWGNNNAVFVGTFSFDVDFLDRASRLFPYVIFHIIGPIKGLPKRDNIVAYGEMPYEQTIPFVKYATIGLDPRLMAFPDNNKVVQYTYCKLPIVAPRINQSDKPHMFRYNYGDNETIKSAIEGALSFDHKLVQSDQVWSWDDLTAALIDEGKR